MNGQLNTVPIVSIRDITRFLIKQAALRSMENDEAGILVQSALFIEEESNKL